MPGDLALRSKAWPDAAQDLTFTQSLDNASFDHMKKKPYATCIISLRLGKSDRPNRNKPKES